VHSPTLLVLAAILSALVTAVLCAVWYFNRQIPGLKLWTLALLGASWFSATLLVRDHMPEVLSVLLAQGAGAAAALMCWQGSRAYMGRKPIAMRHAAAAVAMLLLLMVVFTVVEPRAGVRFALGGSFAGGCFLLTARTLANGGFRAVPARYLLAGVMAIHGGWVLVRPALFGLAVHTQEGLVARLSEFVLLESTLAVVLIGFGVLMLTNEYVTTELRHLAEVDPLTSVFNRRAFLTLLDKALSHAQRTESPLPVLVVDLDYFKRINDTWGHQVGDDALRHFVSLTSRCLRNEDIMGRLGGEEFAIFLPGAHTGGAVALAERLCALVEADPLVDGGRQIALTVSIGIALADLGDAAQMALQRADAAMYLAKERGRNRVELLPTAATDASGTTAAAAAGTLGAA
jgi:diguanylate cyclase (GGDEF)-like protein